MEKKYVSILTVSLLFLLFTPVSAQDQVDGMVYLDGGLFTMGKSGGTDNPAHAVQLDPFYIDIHEVTNAEYARFCEATQHRYPEFWGMDVFKSGTRYPDHPVIGVSCEDARRYAEWVGKRLPTEAEWEYAARGGLSDAPYPDGNSLDTTMARINNPFSEKGPVEVMSYAPNGYGIYDMAGNVWEWVSDWYQVDYYLNSPVENPDGPQTGRFKVIRGGGWHSGKGCHRVDYRNALPQHWVDIAGGFRCAR